ncbi:hypothetical protein DL98DRAFT_576274 [Cadophora sp. DSE1049]|nr:hypothetical protein DL98DRAFT_576274 [Cadophora sp. DSE1049]
MSTNGNTNSKSHFLPYLHWPLDLGLWAALQHQITVPACSMSKQATRISRESDPPAVPLPPTPTSSRPTANTSDGWSTRWTRVYAADPEAAEEAAKKVEKTKAEKEKPLAAKKAKEEEKRKDERRRRIRGDIWIGGMGPPSLWVDFAKTVEKLVDEGVEMGGELGMLHSMRLLFCNNVFRL